MSESTIGRKKKKKSSNPLYVVTNGGKDVEPADNIIELLVKRLGLDPLINILNQVIEVLLEQVTSFAFFKVLKDFIDELVEKLFSLKDKMGPLASFI